MADPTAVTGIVLAATAVVTAATPIVLARRQVRKDQGRDEELRSAAEVANWTALNSALSREVQRLNDSLERLRADYERQLDSAHKRIGELEAEVSALQRLLGSRPA